MLDLPNRTKVNKFIPKKTFYEKVKLNSNVKKEFTNLLERIIWAYKLSPDTIGIEKTNEVEEIQIFELQVREKEIPKKVINTITKIISYPILFIIKYNNEYAYSIKAEKQYYTDWNEDIKFNFKGIDLKVTYENIVKQILKEDETKKDFKTLIEITSKKSILEKEIKVLENKIRFEKQFNRKIELNKKLNNIKKELEKLNE